MPLNPHPPHIHLDPSRAQITLAAAARACLLFDSPKFLPLVQSLRGNNVQDSLQAQQWLYVLTGAPGAPGGPKIAPPLWKEKKNIVILQGSAALNTLGE